MNESNKKVVLNESYNHCREIQSKKEKDSTFDLVKPFLCDFCGKRFRTKPEKVVHLLVHTGEKPFECELCNKKFSQKGNLRSHYKVHAKKTLHEDKNISSPPKHQLRLTQKQKAIDKSTAAYEYACEFCEKKFTSKTYLSVHLRVHTQEKPFQCMLCLKRFSQVGNLKTHLSVHTNQKAFECTVCQKRFAQKVGLQTHCKIHSKQLKQFECQVCHKKFAQKGNLVKHEKLHERAKIPYECDYCSKSYKSKVHFSNHLQTHKVNKSIEDRVKSIRKTCQLSKITNCEKVKRSKVVSGKEECVIDDKILEVTKYVCVICSKSFDKNRNLNLHYQDHVEMESRKINKRSSKQSSFVKDNTNSVNKLINSVATFHSSDKQCLVLGKLQQMLCSSSSGEEKIFKCDFCPKAFKGKQYLLVHLRVHTGEKPYQCEKCNQCFMLKRDLNLHSHSIHSSEKQRLVSGKLQQMLCSSSSGEDRIFKCDFCPKAFKGKQYLLVHLRVHTGEKPYQCEKCNQCFMLKRDLNLHSRSIHSSEKQRLVSGKLQQMLCSSLSGEDRIFKCDFCPKAFKGKQYLLVHRRVHTGEKPYQCEKCNQCFMQKRDLNLHSRSIHSSDKQCLVSG